MSRSPRMASLFSQRLDRAVLGVFFLSAVLPIGALAWIVANVVLPARAGDDLAAAAWIGAVSGLALLSLALFFALRRLTHLALARMDADNRRQARLVAASRTLSAESHFDAIADRLAACAREVAGAEGAVLALAATRDKEPELRWAPGALSRDRLEEHAASLRELAQQTQETGVAVVLENGDAGAGALRAAVSVPIRHPDGLHGALLVLAPEEGPRFAAEAVDALETLAGLASVALHNSQLQEAQRNFFTHGTDLLVTALDAHVENRNGHASHVSRLANQLAREIGLPEDRLPRLHFAALLHDIGMLRIDRSLHRSARACQKHAVIGARMLARIRLWEPAAPVVLHHHEWYDGSGYPEQKMGEAIPLESRIIALADAFDAMSRGEEARPARTLRQCVEEVVAGRGTQFDPRLVDAFLTLVERGEVETAA